MYVQVLPGAIFEILNSAFQTGILTPTDRYGLLAATLDESLPHEERLAIDSLLRAVQQGKVQLGRHTSTPLKQTVSQVT